MAEPALGEQGHQALAAGVHRQGFTGQFRERGEEVGGHHGCRFAFALAGDARTGDDQWHVHAALVEGALGAVGLVGALDHLAGCAVVADEDDGGVREHGGRNGGEQASEFTVEALHHGQVIGQGVGGDAGAVGGQVALGVQVGRGQVEGRVGRVVGQPTEPGLRLSVDPRDGAVGEHLGDVVGVGRERAIGDLRPAEVVLHATAQDAGELRHPLLGRVVQRGLCAAQVPLPDQGHRMATALLVQELEKGGLGGKQGVQGVHAQHAGLVAGAARHDGGPGGAAHGAGPGLVEGEAIVHERGQRGHGGLLRPAQVAGHGVQPQVVGDHQQDVLLGG